MSESPAATIRRAAALMRERAQAATEGPWEHPLPNEVTFGYHQDGSRHTATWIATTDAGDEIGEDGENANAEHIASWHPVVALAVAEWLEAALVMAELAESEGAFINPRSYALKVARAYLNEPVPAEEAGIEAVKRAGRAAWDKHHGGAS